MVHSPAVRSDHGSHQKQSKSEVLLTLSKVMNSLHTKSRELHPKNIPATAALHVLLTLGNYNLDFSFGRFWAAFR